MKLSEDMEEMFGNCYKQGWSNFNHHNFKKFIDGVKNLESRLENEQLEAERLLNDYSYVLKKYNELREINKDLYNKLSEHIFVGKGKIK